MRGGHRNVGHGQEHLRQRRQCARQRFSENRPNTFTINLDPAVKVVSYKPFLDIRDTHEYKKVSQQAGRS